MKTVLTKHRLIGIAGVILTALSYSVRSFAQEDNVRFSMKIDTTSNGFYYHVRFLNEGFVNLPTSVVKVNGQSYETPPLRVWVKPAISDIDEIACSIRTNPEYPRKGERFLVILTCNRQPDAYNPILVMRDMRIEPEGRWMSISEGKEEYQFHLLVRPYEKEYTDGEGGSNRNKGELI